MKARERLYLVVLAIIFGAVAVLVGGAALELFSLNVLRTSIDAVYCPSRWLIPMSGNPRAKASAFAPFTPTSSEPASPGPCVTAMQSISSQPTFACASARSTVGAGARRCCREAT